MKFELEVVKFSVADVITASDNGEGGTKLPEDEL